MEKSVIEVRSISKSFGGVHALKAVSLDIREGEVHCLAGENGSGKSTLIKCISGVNTIDSGFLVLDGVEYASLSTKEAMDKGIQVIYQDLSLFPELTVGENISFNRMVKESNHLMSKARNRAQAGEELWKLEHDIDLDELVGNLSMAERQIVAIARAMSLDARLIIMDEPTTALTSAEVDVLLRTVEGLKRKGVSAIFVSHKLDEVFQISDNITVLRDGVKIGDFKADELDEKALSYHMTGKNIDYGRFEFQDRGEDPILKVDKLSKRRFFSDIDLEIRPGEVVGIIGLLGAGRTELALSLFGLNPADTGTVSIEGKRLSLKSPRQAMDNGIGFLPEDRHVQGLFKMKPVGENIVSTVLDRISNKFHLIDPAKNREVSNLWYEKLRIKASSIQACPHSLSGGNQQRVVLAKWLSTEPKLFILDSPTVGIDVGSKSEIHKTIRGLARSGMGIIIITDELSEAYHNCNRVIVMRDGRFVFDRPVDQTSEKEIQAVLAGRKTDEQQ